MMIFLILLVFCSAGICDAFPSGNGSSRPKLVVMIAVDGLGEDLVERYDSIFTGGFRRLRDQGFCFTNASVDAAFTISHPGHVTLSTGAYPVHHGIVDAAFYKLISGKYQYTEAVDDSTEQIPGVPKAAGVSPRNILLPGLPEWVLGQNRSSRAVAVGSGQYSSLLHAGRMRGDVYWYKADAGKYVTSTYYRKEYPAWVEAFNRDSVPQYWERAKTWENQIPPHQQKLARRDDAPYEAYGGNTIKFPHLFANSRSSKDSNATRGMSYWMASTPVLDAATLALAKSAIRADSLGLRGVTDYLSIVVSQVDEEGHSYGPGSQEQLDNLLRLDRELGEFLSYLDGMFGTENYLLALSADHGMMDIPESFQENGISARRISEKEIGTVLEDIRHVPGRASAAGRTEIMRRLRQYDFIANVMTPEDLHGAKRNDPFLRLYQHSFDASRIPRYPLFDLSDGTSPIGESGVVVRLRERVIIDLDRAIHGSPYDYDRRVPLMFIGNGIPHGVSDVEAHTVDVAPTLARRAGIAVPASVDGRVLEFTGK